jgi:hypothetical protein
LTCSGCLQSAIQPLLKPGGNKVLILMLLLLLLLLMLHLDDHALCFRHSSIGSVSCNGKTSDL